MIFDHKSPPNGTIRDWLDHRANVHGSEPSHFFNNDDTHLTWVELRDAAALIAQSLKQMNIAKGASVALCLPNGKDAIISMFGILYGGYRATPLNLAAGASALGHAIRHSKSKYVFVGESQKQILNDAMHEGDVQLTQLDVDDVLSSAVIDTTHLHPLVPNDSALLMYTSGTTGLPKGVVHTHASLLAGGWTTAVAHQLDPSDRALCVLPFYHINGLCVTLIAPMISGGSVVICTKFSNSRFWSDCHAYKVTWFSLVPTIISHLLHADAIPTDTTQKIVRFARSASAPLAEETQRAFEQRFGIPIVETMGLTETAAQILSNPLPPEPRKIGSAGKAFGNQVSIINADGGHVGTHETGELAIKGPNVMALYLDNYDATAATFTADGWLRTGDLGHCDVDGYFFVTGRSKELIIKGGENIAPREIDEALYSHKDVIEAAAFAKPCPTYGQRVEAAVILSAGSFASDQDLLVLCQQKLGVFKSPDKIHILSELPKGASGKIQRLKLAEIII